MSHHVVVGFNLIQRLFRLEDSPRCLRLHIRHKDIFTLNCSRTDGNSVTLIAPQDYQYHWTPCLVFGFWGRGGGFNDCCKHGDDRDMSLRHEKSLGESTERSP